ncbi:MAG: rhomboid family intramembrane serine protease [Oscillospiraceae bacterium]
MKDFVYRLQIKMHGRCIHDLMKYIVIAQATVFFLDLCFTSYNFISYLTLDFSMVLKGQVWRLITFLFVPPETSIIFILFALYFYYIIGTSLANEWGDFTFDFYYLLGTIGCIIASAITGYSSNIYLNMSLFFAFAVLYPDFRVLLFFFIPIKVKWLAVIDAAFYIISLILGPGSVRVQILFSLLNFFLFFWKDMYLSIKQAIYVQKNRRRWKQ